MGVYAHRFIEVLDKDNKWKALPVWNKHEEDSYGKPDIIVGELKLKKQLCFLQRASSGFYSSGSLFSEDDLSVVSELNKIYFIIQDIYNYYSSDMIRVVFFYG